MPSLLQVTGAFFLLPAVYAFAIGDDVTTLLATVLAYTSVRYHSANPGKRPYWVTVLYPFLAKVCVLTYTTLCMSNFGVNWWFKFGALGGMTSMGLYVMEKVSGFALTNLLQLVGCAAWLAYLHGTVVDCS